MNQTTQGGLNIGNNFNIYRINKEKKVVFYLFEYFIFSFLIRPILLSYENNITLTIMNSANIETILNYQNIEANPIIIDPKIMDMMIVPLNNLNIIVNQISVILL